VEEERGRGKSLKESKTHRNRVRGGMEAKSKITRQSKRRKNNKVIAGGEEKNTAGARYHTAGKLGAADKSGRQCRYHTAGKLGAADKSGRQCTRLIFHRMASTRKADRDRKTVIAGMATLKSGLR
jgi:hypothetical protein